VCAPRSPRTVGRETISYSALRRAKRRNHAQLPSPAAWHRTGQQNAGANHRNVIDLPNVPPPWIVVLSDQLT